MTQWKRPVSQPASPSGRPMKRVKHNPESSPVRMDISSDATNYRGLAGDPVRPSHNQSSPSLSASCDSTDGSSVDMFDVNPHPCFLCGLTHASIESASRRGPSVLKGFEAVDLKPGQSEVVTITLSAHSLSLWDTAAQGWRKSGSKIGISVGASSRDFRLKGTLLAL
ncbi:hypothetical protein AURDEDRAFT_166636 [Auricularia subglabra TFB-10046 SS5]|nr:hypothetical protein AURDEDRAFT_166636 [Auricularia subglabra TFB-10046 SS5]